MFVKKAHKNKQSDTAVNISVQGSKHSFSRIYPSFLQFNTGILRNVPNIKDVEIQIDIMRKLGYALDYNAESKTLNYFGYMGGEHEVHRIEDYSCKYSRSLINLYPLFSRYHMELNEPKGCPIGRRDISWYIDVMRAFGIIVESKDTLTKVYRTKMVNVSDVKIRERSFSSTNIAIACTIETRSDTKIHGPSIEPEIKDLLSMLKRAGVRICYDPESDYIHIQAEDFDENTIVDHTILPDRNVIVTLICGALLLKKDILIDTRGFNEHDLQLLPFLDVLKKLDITSYFSDDAFVVKGSMCCLKDKEIEIQAGHYPLFCSDWQPLIAVLSILGVNMIIEDTLFESRFGYLNEYQKFGIKFRMFNERRAQILNSEDYACDCDRTIKAKALDLRCGAGIGLLSMLHEGPCEIRNVVQIMRGYEGYDNLLNTLIGEEVYSYV